MKNNLNGYKVILVALFSSLVITGVGFIDNYIVNIVLAAIGTAAYAIVGILYSLHLIHGKKAGKEAFAAISIILLLVGLCVYNGFMVFTHWLSSWPLWCKILVPSLLVLAIIVTLIMRYNMKLFKRIIKSKYLYISLAIIVGLLLTILFSRSAYNSDILFGVGSGIFGSAFVTLLIEILSDFRERNKRKCQRDFVLYSLKENIASLLFREIKNLSYFYNMENKNAKWHQLQLSASEVVSKVCSYSNGILTNIIKTMFNKIVIDEKSFQELKARDNYLCLISLPYYQKIQNNIKEILSNSYVYKSDEIFNDDELKLLNYYYSFMEDVSLYSTNKDVETLLEIKNKLFEDIEKLLNILGMMQIQFNIKEKA